jgi:hypothetical protein
VKKKLKKIKNLYVKDVALKCLKMVLEMMGKGGVVQTKIVNILMLKRNIFRKPNNKL